MGIRTFK